MTYLIYADESGDQGAAGSQTYTVACVLVQDALWADVNDTIIEFRRFLKSTLGVPVRAELKANWLLRGSGSYRGMSEGVRAAIYRQAMRIQPKAGIQTFAVVINKGEMAKRTAKDVRDVAWEYLLQRVERFTTKGNTHATLIHDEGDAARVRRIYRWMRAAGIAGSAYGPGVLKRPARLLLDDPSPRVSSSSYLLQLADLNAYAAFRHIFPPPARPVQIVPQTLWDELGTARLAAVSSVKGGPVGIVVAP